MTENRSVRRKSHTGPSNWYRLEYPPSWEEVESGSIVQSRSTMPFVSTLQLSAPDQSGTLLVECFWEPNDDAFGWDRIAAIASLFPVRRNTRRLESLELSYDSAVFVGEAPAVRNDSTLSPYHSEPDWHRWRVWVVRHGPIAVRAVFRTEADGDPESETIAGMIVQSLSIAEWPAEPEEQFTERVLQLARSRFPLIPCEPQEGFSLRLGDSQINLFNLYRSYVASPDCFESVVLPTLTMVVQVQEWGAQQTDPRLKEVRDRIMPMLYREQYWQEQFPNFVGRSWIPGIAVLYVVDEPQAYWYIREDLLPSWNIDRDDLHAIALQNLDKHFENSATGMALVGEEDQQPILLTAKPDTYNASRILSEPFRRELQQVVGQEFAVGIPHRDSFVAVGLQCSSTLEQVRRQVADDFSQRDHPVCEQLLHVTRDGVALLART